MDRLDRINRQLSELYGPLFALNAATDRLRKEFMKLQGLPEETPSFWGRVQTPTLEQAEAWRLWMTTVFMPLNVEMRNAVVDHADLLDDSDSDGMPECLLDLCAHVAGHETVLERWRSGRFDPRDPHDNRSVIKYPAPALDCYVKASYRKLKQKQSEEQSKLLRPTRRRSINSRVSRNSRQAQQIAEEAPAQPPGESRS